MRRNPRTLLLSVLEDGPAFVDALWYILQQRITVQLDRNCKMSEWGMMDRHLTKLRRRGIVKKLGRKWTLARPVQRVRDHASN